MAHEVATTLRVVVVNLDGLEVTPLVIRGFRCEAVTFTDDWRPCRSPASKHKGGYHLCAPHARLSEIEVQNPLTA